MMRKKIVSLCMALALCLNLLPATALAAEGAPGSLYVAGQQITDEGYYTQSGGNWTKSGDASTPPSAPYFHYTKGNDNTPATLTLSGATIQGGTSTGTVPYGAGIYAQCNSGESVSLTIELIGENTITGYYGIYVNAEISADSNGTDASLTITSENNGSLEVSGSNHGIFVKSGTGNASLTIKNASVDAKTTQTYSDYAGVCVQSGASTNYSPNISLSVDGGSLTASASEGNDGIQFYVGSSEATGATTSLTVSDNAIVRANGGIKASRVDEPTPSGAGIVFDGTEGTVYGDVTLDESLTINQGETLTIPNGSSLNGNGKLTNNGTIIVEKGGNLTGNPGGKVVYAPAITNRPQDVEVKENETANFTVEATGTDLSYQWQQSTDKGSSWTNIASATSDTYTTGKTTMDMSGTQYRCVVSNSAGSVTSNAATLTVNAATVPVTGVKLDQTELSLYTGESKTLIATVQPSDATNKNVTWSSDKPEVATVENGKVTAKAAGTATITVTTEDGEKTATCTVTVTRPYIPPANPNYRITLEATQGGTVTADPTAAKAGTTVTLTPVPDRGYQVGSVAVTDRFGDPVAVTEQADGTYTFTMPNGQVTVTVTFAEAPLPFPDVAEGDWFYDAVRYAYETGLMDGVGDSLFAPNSETTRAQLVTILYRLAGQPAVSGALPFTDVESGTWYTDAVLWAAQNGIVNGVSETEFAPGEDITREQLAAILYRYAAYQGYDVSQRADLSGFGDASSISGYAQEALSWAHAQGLVLGFEDGSLRPQGTASRAQIAAVLMRFLAAVPTE